MRGRSDMSFEAESSELLEESIDLPTLGTQLQLLETAMMEVRSRYEQVCEDTERQAELQERRSALKPQGLQSELKQIEQELGVLEQRLESRIFAWNGLQRYFWQTVRFVGLGVAIGWGLAFVVQQQPLPQGRDPVQIDR
jgi:hypothetical protein